MKHFFSSIWMASYSSKEKQPFDDDDDDDDE